MNKISLTITLNSSYQMSIKKEQEQFDEILANLDQNNIVIDEDYFVKIHNNNK